MPHPTIFRAELRPAGRGGWVLDVPNLWPRHLGAGPESGYQGHWRAGETSTVSDTNTNGGVADRRNPRRNRVALAELTLIVRPAGRPCDIQAFTELERADADAYAAQHGCDIDTLP